MSTVGLDTATPKTLPDASNIPAIQQMLRHAYDWGIENGYITFDAEGQPVFGVPEGAKSAKEQMGKRSNVQTGKGAS